MTLAPVSPGPSTGEHHFSCSLTAVLLARVQAFGGARAVADVLSAAGSPRTLAYLSDTVNWISYDETIALLRAGARRTNDPQFSRLVGEDAVRRLNGSPVAALLRSLGSPEAVYGRIAATGSKYSSVTELEAIDAGPGFAEVLAVMVGGYPRDPDHCALTAGLLSQPTILFGLPPATVEHDQCAALGASHCRYRITWEAPTVESDAESARNRALVAQLGAMQERLNSIYATASDLIGAEEINEILARITDRAAVEIRAPRYLLAITTPGGALHCHHRGFEADEAAACAARILASDPEDLPASWLVVPVRSSRWDYGRLLALGDEGSQFFTEERELLEVYARYAAGALDSATALIESKQRYGQSSALLQLARALADAGTSGEIAARLADAVPGVVDCDRTGVYLWEPERGELVRRAVTEPGGDRDAEVGEWSVAPSPGGRLARLLANPRPQPVFIDASSTDEVMREQLEAIDAVASIVVPLVAPDQFLGLVAVSVMDDPSRLEPTPDLLDRLSGIGAQATTALQNGRLVDQITQQALHDGLTGLSNRVQFTAMLNRAIKHGRRHEVPVTLFYLDLDRFKPVNDVHGHAVGDALLVAVGERLTHCTRPEDTVARLGGDEFAILIGARTSPKDLDLVAERLVRAFDQSFTVHGHDLRVGVSAGRATFPTDATDAEGLLREADAKMFGAKRVRHTVVDDPRRMAAVGESGEGGIRTPERG